MTMRKKYVVNNGVDEYWRCKIGQASDSLCLSIPGGKPFYAQAQQGSVSYFAMVILEVLKLLKLLLSC